MKRKIPSTLKTKIRSEIVDSIYQHGPMHKCLEVREKYVPQHVGTSTFYRWVRELKAAAPSRKMVERARQDQIERTRMGKSTKLDDGASLGTIATQGFCNIDYARELTANLENIQDAIDLNNMLLSSIWDKYKPGERVNSEDFAALIETVKLLRSLLDSKTSTIKAAAQVQVQIVDHEHITSFMQRWFDVIKKADSKVALKIAHETRKLGNDFGYSLH